MGQNTGEGKIISYLIKELGLEDKTVRDPVHGDIVLNHLEVSVIDTERFQRLRRIRQLGTAHFVYPGAEHSRFQHSLGTLHMAQVLLRNIRENRFSQYTQFGNEVQDRFFELVVRLAALVHDLHEFPLSHVLEKEGGLFKRQWEDEGGLPNIFGPSSDTYQAIRAKILELLDEGRSSALGASGIAKNDLEQLDKDDLSRRLAATIIVHTFRVIKRTPDSGATIAKKLFNTSNVLINGLLEEKFLDPGNQLVANTISADLLDYSKRDFLFCGIGKTYDERFLKYATVIDKNGKPVFAYRLIKRNEVKSSVLSSLFDVLQLRYALAEFVHTHRTKNSFSAMAIESVNFYYQSLNDQDQASFIEKMSLMGDDELLYYIRTKHDATARILSHYYKRTPYSQQNLIEAWEGIDTSSWGVVKDPEQRLFLEKCAVEWYNKSNPLQKIKDGDVLFYAMPSPDDLYKEMETFVVYLDANHQPQVETMALISKIDQPYGKRRPVTDAVVNRVVKQRQELIELYKNLWQASVYLSPDVPKQFHSAIGGMTEQLFASLNYSFKVSESKQLPSELYSILAGITQADGHRSFKTFKDLYGALSSN